MTSCDHRARLPIALAASLLGLLATAADASEPAGVTRYYERVEPILAEYCYGCHALGIVNAGVAFDEFESDAAILASPDLWSRALEQLRAGLMPPKDEPGPSAESRSPRSSAGSSTTPSPSTPSDPDPGRVTVRRLNRVEYRNTIRDLIGVDFDTDRRVPARRHRPRLRHDRRGPDDLAAAAGEVPRRRPGDRRPGDGRGRRGRPPPSPRRRFEFPEPIPDDPDGRRAYARELLGPFATRAFRRPGRRRDRRPAGRPGRVAFGASRGPDLRGRDRPGDGRRPRLAPVPLPRGGASRPGDDEPYPLIDEYALASRLSYFLWSTMPDDELFRLAGARRAARGPGRRRSSGCSPTTASGEFVRQLRRPVAPGPRRRDACRSTPSPSLARDRPPDPEADRRRDRFRELRRKPDEELTEDEKKELEEIRESFSDFVPPRSASST